MKGRIHSIETMGLTDGPGIRTVIFFQGCKLRCKYCHNPDTWNITGGNEISTKDLIKKIIRFKPYFSKSGGGITCSGGEPLMQPEFLIELLKVCKEHNISTAIDTSGFGVGKYEEILMFTDLVILDIKHTTPNGYKSLTGGNFKEFEVFIDTLKKMGNKTWIRHVVVPGITDNTNNIKRVKNIANKISNVERIELLPYHKLGVHKYDLLGIDYKLEKVNPMCIKELEKLKEVLA